MGMTFVYRPDEPLGRQYSIVCGKNHLLGAAMVEGLTEVDVQKLLHQAHIEARKTRESSPIRVPRAKSKAIQLDAEVVAGFIREKFVPQRQSSVLFCDFYRAFVAWLEPSVRGRWSRIRVSKALPDLHPSVPSHNNIRVIKDLRQKP